MKVLTFFGQDGQNRSLPPVPGPEGFQEKLSTSSYRPSFLRHVPALVEDEFSDPEFCKSVAGLERMLRVRARVDKTPGVWNSSVGGGERDLAVDSQVQGVASGQCSDEQGVGEFSSGFVDSEHSVVLVASDLQQQVPTIQTIQKFVPNILPDPVLPSVAGALDSNKRVVEDGFVAVRASSSVTGLSLVRGLVARIHPIHL